MTSSVSYVRSLIVACSLATVLTGVCPIAVRAQTALPILSSHPRIWLTPTRLARLKADAANNTQRWQLLLASANAYLTADPSSNPLLYLTGAKNCAIVYQVTGNPMYAQAALRLATYYAIPANNLPDGFDYRQAFPYETFALDWCYDQATAAQRQQIETWLMNEADALWPETNPSATSRWAVADPGNNYFWGYMYDWDAALACFGDDPRAAVHAQLSQYKYETLARPYLEEYGLGGLFQEGTNYDSTMFVGQILDGVDTSTGTDFVNDPGNTFLRDSLYWRLYSTTPTRDYEYPQGAQSRVPSAPLFDYDRWRANVANATVDDVTATSYGKDWLDTITPDISSLDSLLAEEFLYYDDTDPSIDYTTVLPTSYFAPGIGFLTNRSDWSTSATYWGIWAGPNFQAHQDQDVNGFMIWDGGTWLAGNDSIWSGNGTLTQTIYHNNLTFGGADSGLQQTWQYPDASYPNQGGKCLVHEVGPDYTYFAGQGAQAYVQSHSNPTPPVTDYVRKFVWISPGLFFIYDRATLTDPSQDKEFHLHSLNPITVNGRSYEFNNGGAQLFGQSLLPATGLTVSTVPVTYGTTSPTSYRVDVVTSNNNASDTMLNVLQATPMGAQDAPSQAIVASSGYMEGGDCNGWVVMFGKSEPITSAVAYTVPAGPTVQDLVLDQEPNLQYSVNINGAVSAVTASASGSMRFATPGGAAVRISPLGPIPFSITGRVVNSAGTNLYGVPGVFGVTVSAGGKTASTDAGGLYTITGLAAGTYTVSATLSGFQFGATQTATVGPNATVNFTGKPVIGTTYSVSGSVMSSDGPVAGAVVAMDGHAATTGANGAFTVSGIPTGTWVASASILGYTMSESQVVTVGSSNVTGVNFNATWVGFSIYGTVTCSGAALPGATITIGSHTTTSDSNGNWGITGLEPGTYTISASMSGYTFSSPWTVTVGPEATGVNFTATRGGTIVTTYSVSGAVTMNGTGLGGAIVSASNGARATTNASGTYALAKLTPGSYSISASATGYTCSGAKSVTVGPSATGVNFTVATASSSPTFAISGQVTLDGAGLSGVIVSTGSAAYAVTNVSGTYTISGLTAGSYSVAASEPGYTFGSSQSVTVGPEWGHAGFVATPKINSSALRINCGGGAYASPTTGTWLGDTDVSGGADWTYAGLTVTGTPDPTLLRTVHYGSSNFTYTLPAGPGVYTLVLYFVEGDSRATTGWRVFNVLANGKTILSKLDIYARSGGLGKAFVRTFTVTVPSGSQNLVLKFEPISSSAMVSAINLTPSG